MWLNTSVSRDKFHGLVVEAQERMVRFLEFSSQALHRRGERLRLIRPATWRGAATLRVTRPGGLRPFTRPRTHQSRSDKPGVVMISMRGSECASLDAFIGQSSHSGVAAGTTVSSSDRLHGQFPEQDDGTRYRNRDT